MNAETKLINQMIVDGKIAKTVNTNDISDGFHTFKELYDHRIELFIALCRIFSEEFAHGYDVFKTPVKDGWFILGINLNKGEQITYHIPETREKDVWFAHEVCEKEYEFDGHTSQDVLERLKQL